MVATAETQHLNPMKPIAQLEFSFTESLGNDHSSLRPKGVGYFIVPAPTYGTDNKIPVAKTHDPLPSAAYHRAAWFDARGRFREIIPTVNKA